MIAEPSQAPKRADKPLVQPLHAVQLDNALLKIQTVSAVVGRSPATIRRGVRDGSFPAPIKDGVRCTRWVSNDVRAWLARQVGQRGEVQQ